MLYVLITNNDANSQKLWGSSFLLSPPNKAAHDKKLTQEKDYCKIFQLSEYSRTGKLWSLYDIWGLI